MAEEAEDEDRPAEDYAYVPPAHPEFVRIRNQVRSLLLLFILTEPLNDVQIIIQI